MKADWSSSAACPSKPVRGEHLVPVVADPAAGPAIPAAAGQAHRVGVGRSEERLGRGGAPVDQQPATRAVGEAEPSDVHGLGVVRADDTCPRHRSRPKRRRVRRRAVSRWISQVPVHRLLADAAGRLALGVEAVGQVGDRLLEALRDGREVLLVAGDQRRVGLGGEAVGKVERAGRQRVHVISSDLRSLATIRRRAHPHLRAKCPQPLPRVHHRFDAPARPIRRQQHALRDSHFRRFWPRLAILRHDPGLAASPPVRYMLKVERGGCRRPRRISQGLRMQPRNVKFCTLVTKAGSSVVESVADHSGLTREAWTAEATGTKPATPKT